MTTELLFHVLLALAAVVIAGRALGALVARFGQPPVIGEVLSGILLGPSLLGALAPGIEGFLFPASARPTLGVIAQRAQPSRETVEVVHIRVAHRASSLARRPAAAS